MIKTTFCLAVVLCFGLLCASELDAQTAPPNDNFANRITLSSTLPISATGSNINATREGGEPNPYGFPHGHSVWWTWTATQSGPIQVSTIGSNFDTVILVYEGNSLTNLTLLVSDDQSGGSNTSLLTFNAVAGRSYQIAVDGWADSVGSIVLNLLAQPTITSLLTAYATVGESFTYQITTANLVNPSFYAASLPAGLSLSSSTGLISGTPTTVGPASVFIQATSTMPGYQSASAYLQFSVGTLEPTITSEHSATATQGKVFNYQITATNNPTSYIASSLPGGLSLDTGTGLISGTPASVGNFSVLLSASNSHGTGSSFVLNLNVLSPKPVVAAADATATVAIPFVFQINATNEPTSYDAQNLPAGLNVDAATGVISGTPTTPGFYLVDLGASNSFGTGSGAVLGLTVYTAKSDSFATRVHLRGSKVAAYVSNQDATKENGEPNHAGNPGGASLWWTWTAPETGQYQINVVSGFDTLFGIYEGSSLGALRVVVNNAGNGFGHPVSMSFVAKRGQHYQIAVDGANGAMGDVELSLERMGEHIRKPLTITTTGAGTVTPGFLGETLRELGVSYTVVAKPAPGFIFNAWMGSVSSSSEQLTFSMQEGMFLEADFAPNPLAPFKGDYFGVLSSSSDTKSNSTSGFIRLAMDGNGSFTAALTFGGSTYRIHGTFDQTGSFTASIPRLHQWPLTITLGVDLTNPSAGQVSGIVADDVSSASFLADRSTLTAKSNPATQAGRYTFAVFPQNIGGSGDPSIPQGYGYGIMNVSASGQVRVLGVLPDGTHITQGSQLTDAGTWPIYLPLYSGEGSISGLMTFSDTDEDDVAGVLDWFKPPHDKASSYPAGISAQVTLSGSRYKKPSRRERIVAASDQTWNAGVFIDVMGWINAGTMVDEEGIAVTLTAQNKIIADPADHFSMKIHLESGLFTGRLFDPVANRIVPFSGAFLQKANQGAGLYQQSSGQTRYVVFAPLIPSPFASSSETSATAAATVNAASTVSAGSLNVSAMKSSAGQ